MRRRFHFTALGLLLVVTGMAWATPARAGFIANVSSSITPQPGGGYLYSYTVSDSASSTLAVSEFDMVVPSDANLQMITSPAGFLTLYSPTDLTISFSSTDPSTDIAPGMFGSFSFVSMDAPVLGTYSLLTFDDPNGFGAGDVLSGTSLAPGAVPEPGSLLLVGLGLPIAIALMAHRRHRRLAAASGSST